MMANHSLYCDKTGVVRTIERVLHESGNVSYEVGEEKVSVCHFSTVCCIFIWSLTDII